MDSSTSTEKPLAVGESHTPTEIDLLSYHEAQAGRLVVDPEHVFPACAHLIN